MILIVILSFSAKAVVLIVALPESPVFTVYNPLVADSAVEIIKSPDNTDVPFFSTSTAKFAQVDNTHRLIFSLENVNACPAGISATVPTVVSPAI